MTTIAMGAGMLPIALGLGVDPSFRSPMAIVVIGGLITSTFLSLLIIPVIFTYVDDVVQFVGRLAQRKRAPQSRWRPAPRPGRPTAIDNGHHEPEASHRLPPQPAAQCRLADGAVRRPGHRSGTRRRSPRRPRRCVAARIGLRQPELRVVRHRARPCRAGAAVPARSRQCRPAGAAGGVLARHRRLTPRLQLPGPLLGHPVTPACTCSTWAATAACGPATPSRCWAGCTTRRRKARR